MLVGSAAPVGANVCTGTTRSAHGESNVGDVHVSLTLTLKSVLLLRPTLSKHEVTIRSVLAQEKTTSSISALTFFGMGRASISHDLKMQAFGSDFVQLTWNEY